MLFIIVVAECEITIRESRSLTGELGMTCVINAVQEKKKRKERKKVIEREIARTKNFLKSLPRSCLVNRSLEMA
jgi:hypothetical protein